MLIMIFEYEEGWHKFYLHFVGITSIERAFLYYRAGPGRERGLVRCYLTWDILRRDGEGVP